MLENSFYFYENLKVIKRLPIIKSTLFILFSFFSFPQLILSQEKRQLGAGIDLVSRYVWRGMDMTGASSIQPWVNYDVKGFCKKKSLP